MNSGTELYLDLLERVVTNVIYRDAPLPTPWSPDTEFDLGQRAVGLDWPSEAHTMVGRTRIRHVRQCLEQVIADDVPGDFIETGVWRGGVCIFVRGLLNAYGQADRRVWVADSFQGIPDVGKDGPEIDRRLALHESNDVLAVSLAQVKENFARYGLLDDGVRFLPGWFAETLPSAPIERLSVLRLDGDLYSSTMDSLNNLYPKLSVGGFVIIDDYSIEACRRAVHDFRDRHGIDEPIDTVDQCAVAWRRKGH